MNEEEFKESLRQQANQHLNDGVSKADVQAWVDRQKSRYAEKYGGAEQTQEPSQDAAVPPQEVQQPYQPDYAEIKRKNDSGEQLTKDEHNAQQEVFSKVASSAPGFLQVPEFMVPAVSAFGEGVAGLASGTVKGLKSIALYAKEKFDPEFAAQVAEDPEVRKQYLSSITDVDEKIDEFAGDLSVGKREFDSSSITELAANGELAQAGELAAQQVAGAVPSVLATMSGWGGMAALGVSAAGSSFEEDMEKHPDQTIDRLVGAAWAKGGVELASEMVTRGIAKRAGLLMGKGQSVDAAKQFTQGALRRLTKDASMEGLSEGGADTASKYIDELVHGDEYTAKQYLTDFLDNAIVGAALGGGVSSIGALNSGNTMERAAAAEVLKSDETAAVEKEAQEKINAALEQKKKLNENTAEDQTTTERENELSLINDVLDMEIATQQQKVSQAKKADLDALNDMTSDEITRVAKAKDRARTAEKAEAKETDSDKKQILKNIARDSKKQVSEVYDAVNNHETVVQQAEAVQDEADAIIDEQQKAITEEEAKPEKKNTKKIEKAKQKIKEEAAKKQQAAIAVEQARPGYDHNLKSKRAKDLTYEEAVAKRNEALEGKNKTRADLYYAQAKKATDSYAKTATNKAYDQLLGYGAKMSIGGKALTREDVRKYVDDEVNKAIDAGKPPYVRDLVRRAKRKVLQEYSDKTIKKPGKKATIDEKENYKRAKAIKAKEDAALESIKPQEERLRDLERQVADPNLPRKQKRDAQSELDVLRDEVDNAKAIASDAVITSLDQAVGVEESSSLSDLIKTADDAEVEAPQTAEAISKKAGIDETQRGHIQSAVRDAIDLGGLDISSDSAVNEVGADPVVETEIQNAIAPFTKSKKDVMDNAQQVIDLLPEGFKNKRNIQDAADLDDFISGTNQSRALGDVRKAVKAGIIEGFIDQAAQDGDGIDMNEYMENTAQDNKAGVQAMVMHLNRMYPGIKFFMSKSKVMETLIEAGVDPGKVDGIGGMLTPNGEIILNPDLVTMETPIHELGHVWAKGIRTSDPKLYNRGVELMKQTSEWKELVMKSKDPTSVYYNYGDTQLAEEGVATLIGVHGKMKFGDARSATEAQTWIADVMDYIKQKLGFKVDENTTLHDFLDHAVNEIISGKAQAPAKVQVEYMEAVDGLPSMKKELARLRKLPKDLKGVAENIQRFKTRIAQVERMSLPQATKLADMMMLNPVIKNAIRAAKPVERTRYRTYNTDAQARKTVGAVMQVMSALPAAGRVEFANQLSRGIKSNTLAGQQNVAGFQNSIIAREILDEAGIEYDGIDMSGNLLSGVAEAMNKQNVRGVFGEDVNWGAVDYKGGSPETVAANKGAIEAFFNTLAGLNKLGKIDGQTINKIQNIWGAAGQHSLYRGATGAPKFFHKGAKKGKGAQKGYIREHVLPASEFFDEAFSAARNGNLSNKLGQLLDNYQLVLLSESDDTRVNSAGFKERQPDVFGEFQDQKLGELPASYMRYFNGKVAINPTDYVDASGRTMASYMGISPEAQEALQSSGIAGIEFSESTKVNEATAKNADANNKIRKSKEKAVVKQLKDRYVYKSPGDFKQSKIPQETRDILDATLKHFEQVKGQLSDMQLESLSNKIEETITEGKATVKGMRSEAKKAKEERQQTVNDLVEETGGVNPEEMTSNQVAKLNADRKGWFSGIKNFKLSNLLSPASNNDFYGLLYNLYPKGANRAGAKKFIDDQLVKPLEEAGVKYMAMKQTMKDSMLQLKENTGVSHKQLMSETGIAIEGIPNLTNDQAIRIYNYIKDPKLHKQLKNTKIDDAKMIEIANYINKNAQLKTYAEGLVGVYATAAGSINSKLNEHGRETFSNVKIDQSKLSPEELEVLNAAFPEGIPEFAPYTPLTAEGTDSDTTFESLTKDGNFNMYTVMDGRLKRRSGGGDINLLRSTTDSDFDSYVEGPVHTYAYLDFARNASNVFGPKQIKAMEAAYGASWSSAMKDSLRRIVTGKAQTSYQPEAIREFNKWVNRTVGGIMFFNVKSALLQQISTFNFAADDVSAVLGGWKSKNKDKVRDFLKESDWVKQRGEGRTEVAMEELFSQRDQNWIDTVLEKGYSLTKAGDKMAILRGGAPYMAGKYDQYIKDGMPEQEAMNEAYRDFIRQAEETQQSTRQERLGQQQTSGVGKLLLAFANTQQQYNRKMAKAVKDIAAGDNVGKNIKTLMYYGGIQNIMFTTSQKLLFAGIGLNENDEEDNAATWANALADTILRGIGVWGGIAAAAKNAIIAASAERGADKKVMEALVNAAPAVGTKIRNITTALNAKPIYANSEWADYNPETAVMAYRAAAAANAVANIPLDRAVKLFEQSADLFASDLDTMDRLLRAGGWSRYDLGESAGTSPLNKVVEVEDSDPEVLGRANKDGSVEINPNLSPAQRKKVMDHEGKHAKDMKSGKLDYTDNSITYNGKKYDRKGGKIYHGGKWVIEGDHSLPWEKEAKKAEKSPLKRTKPKPGSPEWDEYVREGKQFNKDWYDNPTSQKLFAEQAPRFKGGASDRYETIDETHFDEGPASGAIAEYWRNNYADEEAGEHKHNVEINPHAEEGVDTPGLVAHEATHAAGWDYDLGKEAKKHLGESQTAGQFGRYLNNPDEAYANLQGIRQELGLKPDQRDLTPEQLQELVDEKGSADTKAYIKNFSLENVANAHNKTADASFNMDFAQKLNGLDQQVA